MNLGIDPKIDYAFKHLFGRETTRPLLINLIDEVLATPAGHHILEIDLLNPFNPKEALDDKLSILDIKARDQTGRQFNIEMQMLGVPDYEKRILHYACKFHQQQLRSGKPYAELKQTISISFLNHIRFHEVPDYHLRFRLLEEARHFPLTEDMEFHLLELPKFKKTAGELASGLDIWLYFLRNAEMMDVAAMPTALQQPLWVRAMEELKMLTQDDIERERYEARMKALSDHNTIMRALQEAREGKDAALQRGHETGLQEGRQKGLLEGRQEGRQEGLTVGQQIGIIHFCERLLNRPETPTAALTLMSLEELIKLAEDLQGQVRVRKQ